MTVPVVEYWEDWMTSDSLNHTTMSGCDAVQWTRDGEGEASVQHCIHSLWFDAHK